VEGNTSAVLSRLDYELETLTVFEDVFVPWERVFLYRNTGLAGRLATLFANFHRFTAISYRSAMANLYLGAALEAAKSNGLTAEKHVRDDLLEIVTYKELMRMSAIAASSQPLLLGGVAVPNPVYTNIGKIYSNTHFTDLLRSLIDISGGIIATLPSQEDLNTSSKDLIEKYMRGAVDGASRIKTLKLAKELGATSMAGYMLTLMIHAEGSIESSKIELFRNYDFSEATRLVNKILNTNTDQDTSTG
jgi:4-hydroxybutyryl-CoA dehydratase/vinylacetyl-CoA-Delta-isomerase